jgi:hypothetical protein
LSQIVVSTCRIDVLVKELGGMFTGVPTVEYKCGFYTTMNGLDPP